MGKHLKFKLHICQHLALSYVCDLRQKTVNRVKNGQKWSKTVKKKIKKNTKSVKNSQKRSKTVKNWSTTVNNGHWISCHVRIVTQIQKRRRPKVLNNFIWPKITVCFFQPIFVGPTKSLPMEVLWFKRKKKNNSLCLVIKGRPSLTKSLLGAQLKSCTEWTTFRWHCDY